MLASPSSPLSASYALSDRMENALVERIVSVSYLVLVVFWAVSLQMNSQTNSRFLMMIPLEVVALEVEDLPQPAKLQNQLYTSYTDTEHLSQTSSQASSFAPPHSVEDQLVADKR